MRTSDSLSNIAPALCQAQAGMKGVAKSGRNTYDRYTYANLEDYVSSTRPILAKHGLSVFYSTPEARRLEDRTTSQGKVEHAVEIKMTVTLLHTSGEWISIDVFGEGQDRGDKAMYKAVTGARKYGIACLLGLTTTDDPEADESVARDVEPLERAGHLAVRNGSAGHSRRATVARHSADAAGDRKPARVGNGDGNGARGQAENDAAPLPFRNAKKQLIANVREWTECSRDQAVAKCNRIFAHLHLPTDQPLTDEQAAFALNWVTEQVERGVPFESAVA